MKNLTNQLSLGYLGPFIRGNDLNLASNRIHELVNLNEINQVDLAGILSLISKGYLIGDRTVIAGIHRTPWMTEISGTRSYISIPKVTQNRVNTLSSLSEKLNNELKNEIRAACYVMKSIGILLTGGMDSRVIAAVLNDIKKNEWQDKQITAITWGLRNSRDVQYAARIAKQFSWKHIIIPIDSKVLLKNISLTAELGAEFSPAHLHAAAAIREIPGIDIIIAGSFGDSIGRAEYSSVKASKLRPIKEGITNKYKILLNKPYKIAYKTLTNDIKDLNTKFPTKSEVTQREFEMQANYMRRLFNPIFNYISEKIPVYQVFSAVETYKLMWSSNINLRDDHLYKEILMNYDSFLLEIPWARTGKKYLAKKGTPDSFLKNYHEYGVWTRHDLYDNIYATILNGNLESLGIFNMNSIKCLIHVNKSIATGTSGIDETLLWLASFAKMLEVVNIKTCEHKYTLIDYFNILIAKFHYIPYLLARRILR